MNEAGRSVGVSEATLGKWSTAIRNDFGLRLVDAGLATPDLNSLQSMILVLK